MNKDYRCKAAFSQIDITPDFQVELIGGNIVRSQGVLHHLYAQTLLCQNDDQTFCLITIDNLGLTRQLAYKLRSKVAQQLNTEISNIMICFSHTHAAPAPTSFALNGERYYSYMCEQISKCVENAKMNYLPCKAGWALTDTNIGVNRREGCTVVDDRLGALKIIDLKSGNPMAVLLRITAHANVLMADNYLISSDYFGVAREKLQNYFSCPIMLIQGAAGNINPIGTDKIQGGTISDLDKIANILIDSARRLRFEIEDINDIQMLSKNIVLYSDVPSETEAKRIAADGLRTYGIDGTNWLLECEKLRKSEINEQSLLGEIQFFKWNKGCICGVSDEIFCEISLEAKETTENQLLFLNGYTNGCTGYLPNGDEWQKGGYEILYSYLIYYPFHGHVMPFRDDTAERLVSRVVEEWHNFNHA